jgi:hypothetical protein
MSKNPLNLAVRFLLELAAVISFGAWGYSLTEGTTRFILALLFPVLFAVLRSGKTVVPTPGIIRLILELALFGAATWMLLNLDYSLLALIFGLIVAIHYIFSYNRIAWLLKQK